MQRTCLSFWAGLGCLATLVRPVPASQVVVYSPHGKELLGTCEERFEAEHPGVDVRWLDMGSQEILDRVRTEARHPRAQIWFGAPATMFMTAAREGLLAPYEPTWAASVRADHHDAEDRWYGTFLTPEVILYNRNALPEEEAPRNFEELLQPRFTGRVILREPLASGTMRTILSTMIVTAPNVDEGLRRLARLDAQTVAYAANPTLLFQGLARGRGDVTLWNLPDAILQIEQYHYPFGYRVPEGGTPVLVDGIAILAGCDDVDDARAFYEFVTSAPLATEMARRFYRIPVRLDLDPRSLPAWMRTPVDALPMDWTRLATDGPAWMNEFDRRIKGRGREYLQEQGR
jgi:iron(III) transport system substrate-binding protein